MKKRTERFLISLLVFMAVAICVAMSRKEQETTENIPKITNDGKLAYKNIEMTDLASLWGVFREIPKRDFRETALVADSSPPIIACTPDEIALLFKCVEAEDGIGSYESKVMVARVIINRVLSDKFPNTVTEVIKQPRQFQVWKNNRIWEVEVTQETKDAVTEALTVPSDFDALYFANPSGSDSKWYKWLVNHCEYVATDKDGLHNFFK